MAARSTRLLEVSGWRPGTGPRLELGLRGSLTMDTAPPPMEGLFQGAALLSAKPYARTQIGLLAQMSCTLASALLLVPKSNIFVQFSPLNTTDDQ